VSKAVAGFPISEIVLPGVVGTGGLIRRDRNLPRPGAGRAIVRVEASGISFAERAMRRGRYPGQPKFPFVPGYDLVGIVVAVGADADAGWCGTRVAVLTKTGGWATHANVSVDDLLPVPDAVSPAEVETLVVNGITAWQMLHREARVAAGQTILVHGANGGVGTNLVQLAKHAGVRVIGSASPRHHDALRALGVEPVDYDDPDFAARVRLLAPLGVDAVFDHIGGASVSRSYRLLTPRGTLVSYAMASSLRETTPMIPQFFRLLANLMWWNALPNGRKAVFYNIWQGRHTRPKTFRANLRRDFAKLMEMLVDGVLTPHIAARFPLDDVGAAMELAESGTVHGKIVLTP